MEAKNSSVGCETEGLGGGSFSLSKRAAPKKRKRRRRSPPIPSFSDVAYQGGSRRESTGEMKSAVQEDWSSLGRQVSSPCVNLDNLMRESVLDFNDNHDSTPDSLAKPLLVSRKVRIMKTTSDDVPLVEVKHSDLNARRVEPDAIRRRQGTSPLRNKDSIALSDKNSSTTPAAMDVDCERSVELIAVQRNQQSSVKGEPHGVCGKQNVNFDEPPRKTNTSSEVADNPPKSSADEAVEAHPALDVKMKRDPPQTSGESHNGATPKDQQILEALEIVFATFTGKRMGTKTALKLLEAQFGFPLTSFEPLVKRRLKELKKPCKSGSKSTFAATGCESVSIEPVVLDKVSNQHQVSPRSRTTGSCDLTKLPFRRPPSTATVRSPRSKPVKVTKPKKRSCALCRGCICNSLKNAGTSYAADWSQSDFSVERSLIRRLLKLEQQTEMCAQREGDCRRRLKRHRKEMYKKRERMIEMGQDGYKQKSRFLRDHDQMKEFELLTGLRKESTGKVTQAISSVFGAKTSNTSKAQVTLTQMLENSADRPGTEDGIQKDLDLEPIVEEGSVDVEVVQENTVEHLKSSPSCRRTTPDVPFQSIDVGNDKSRGLLSAWKSVASGSFRCGFDRLFDVPADAENVALDDLIDSFTDDAPFEEPSEAVVPERIQLGMLSPRGHSMASQLISVVNGNPEKLKRLRASCPNWEENILFAMSQKEEELVNEALEQVKTSKERLKAAKDAMLLKFSRQEEALDVFEESLYKSLTRIKECGQSKDVE